MGCSSCGSGGCGTGESGCGKSGGCSTGGCNKLNTFDWLGNMDWVKTPLFKIVEIRFKSGRKEFFKNANELLLTTGDPVMVEMSNGHHLGHVSLQGELVRLQMKKKNVADDDNIKNILRIASTKDLDKYQASKKRESPTLFRARQVIDSLSLDMKLSDVEYQADNTKATFFYSAEDRVDFRELIKLLAGEFKIRVEMKQISLRQEAGRLGGIGSCGRELCCSTWLTEFKSVSTSAARYQNLSLNPTKLSGQCGRLKCCLNYELETYMDALKGIPAIEDSVLTAKGEAFLQKTDIFRKIMWFGYRSEESNWYPLSVARVNEILELNKKGIKPATLEADEIVIKEDVQAIKDKNELSRFDEKFQNAKKRPNNKRKNKKGKPNAAGPRVNPPTKDNRPKPL
ncbi:MAG TPA: regulatory iron-sulfur-containing complex subunit RicT [Cytophagaceae bacterium]|jgi:cell fate regulator YaaT (PSP1 superfamily)